MMGEPTPERGGRAKRFYQVSAQGVRALQTARNAMLKLWKGLESVLGKTR